jgi:hypothetical protein
MMSSARLLPFVLFSLVLAFPGALEAQGFGSYLPEGSAAKASRLLASVDRYSSLIEARRAELRRDELDAEAESVEAYALLVAARGSSSVWATRSGSLRSLEAKAYYESSRAKARQAARALASDAELSESTAARDQASASLAKLLLSSSIGAKSALGVERLLAAKSKDPQPFPEAAQIERLLGKAGAAGAREAAAAEAYRGGEGQALALVAAKARILALASAADGPMARLEAELDAYRAWIVAYAAAHPGDLASSASFSDAERSSLAKAIRALASLDAGRAASLMEAMASGDGRDQSAAAAGRLLAEAWEGSSAAGRRVLSSLCGVSEATMSCFGSALAPQAVPRDASPRLGTLAIMSSLGALSVRIADEEADPSLAKGPEPSLVLLEKPELAAAAKGEERYATLFAEASRRLGSIYSQAAEDACARLEAAPSVSKAAETALGGAASSLVVSSVDLSLPARESGRRLAFVASASDSQGSSVSLPIRPELSAEVYAASFAKASGIGSPKSLPAELLSRYGQWIVAAYDPEGENDGLVVDVFPKGGGPARVGSLDLELALLGGWQP